jgi:hypothetical protein
MLLPSTSFDSGVRSPASAESARTVLADDIEEPMELLLQRQSLNNNNPSD